MKKTNLVLFPVLAALLLAGCTATKKSGKKKKSSSVSETSQTTGGKTSSGGGVTSKSSSQGGSSSTPGPSVVPPTPGGWNQITSAPSAGGDFLFGRYNGTDHTFLDGEMIATYYLSCKATEANAIHFTLEASGTGFLVKATSGSVSGKYLAITCTDGSHVNGSYSTTGSIFDWVTEDSKGNKANTLGVSVDKGDGYGAQYYILAQQSGKDSLSPTFGKYWETNYRGCLYSK